VNTFLFVLVNLNTGSSNNFCKHCPPWPKLSAQVKHLVPKYQIAFCCFLLNILVPITAIITLVSSSVERMVTLFLLLPTLCLIVYLIHPPLIVTFFPCCSYILLDCLSWTHVILIYFLGCSLCCTGTISPSFNIT
jgi:hypothetical protein